MKPAKNIGSLLVSSLGCLLFVSCASPRIDDEQEGWKQLAAAADAAAVKPGKVSLHFTWEVPKKRVLMLARPSEDQAVLYRIDYSKRGDSAGRTPGDPAQVNCYLSNERLYCAALGEPEPTLVAMPSDNLWARLATDAERQANKLNLLSQEALQAQLTNSDGLARYARERHPFEWGGKYETVENAQAFLEALSAKGIPFKSTLPRAPLLGYRYDWKDNDDQLVTFRTTKRCSSLASSASRTAAYSESSRPGTFEGMKEFPAVFRWQQPIEWGRLGGGWKDGKYTAFGGRFAGPFDGQGVTFLGGRTPGVVTGDVPRFEVTEYERSRWTRFVPTEYEMGTWNVYLVLPNVAGLQDRVLYAVTYLQMMCRHG